MQLPFVSMHPVGTGKPQRDGKVVTPGADGAEPIGVE